MQKQEYPKYYQNFHREHNQNLWYTNEKNSYGKQFIKCALIIIEYIILYS